MRSFFSYLSEISYREDNPTELLESPHLTSSFFESVSYDEVDLILNSIDISSLDPLLVRDRAFLNSSTPVD